MDKVMNIAGRVLLAQIFILAGINKIGAYAATQAYMEAMGVAAMLLPLVIVLELGAGIALLVGWKTRWAAWALAVFTLVAAFVFHGNLNDQIQGILFMKNLAIAGGLLVVSVSATQHGWSVDRYLQAEQA